MSAPDSSLPDSPDSPDSPDASLPAPAKLVTKEPPARWVVVGLGNPGLDYADTPHNLGFRVIARLAEQFNIRVTRPEARSLTGLGEIESRRVLLATPLTYMNLSGGAVRELLKKYEASREGLLLVFDELSLPFGQIRIRERGSAGGHNGVESVIDGVGSPEFTRIRLGIAPDRPVAPEHKAQYVLKPFPKSWKEPAEELVDRGADAVRMLLRDGVAKAMNEFNRPVEKEK
jgi:PTH1 family peptidyl-tRNA hydrolase